MPTVTKYILIANVAAFLLQMYAGNLLVAHFALWPPGRYPSPALGTTVGFEPWQLVTSAFLHGNLFHIAFNMFALHIFGSDLERLMGPRYYLALYTASVLVAAIVQLAVVTAAAGGGDVYPTLGASGGVFGLLLAFGLLFPDRTLMLIFPPIPMPARLFALCYGAIELLNGVIGSRAGIAHFAHLGGMLGGYLVLVFWRRRGRWVRRVFS